MRNRPKDSIVWVGGSLRPMTVVEPDTYRDGHDRARRRYIKLRPHDDPDAKAIWYRSDMVTGDGDDPATLKGGTQ